MEGHKNSSVCAGCENQSCANSTLSRLNSTAGIDQLSWIKLVGKVILVTAATILIGTCFAVAWILQKLVSPAAAFAMVILGIIAGIGG